MHRPCYRYTRVMTPTAKTVITRAFNVTRERVLAERMSVAQTHWTRLLGLLFTNAEDFARDGGMWISPCRGIHTLGMRFSIDAIYLGKSLQVVHLVARLPPWRIAPVRRDARSILEVPSGTIAASQTQIGDIISLQ